MKQRYTFDFNEDDYIDYQLTYFETADMLKKTVLRARVLFAVCMFVLGGLCYLMYSGTAFILAEILIGIMAVVFTVSMKNALRKTFLRNARSILRESEKTNPILGTVQLEFTDDRVIYKKDGITSEIIYTKMTHPLESDKSVFLYFSPVQAIIIPKRCFVKYNEKEDLLSTIFRSHEEVITR